MNKRTAILLFLSFFLSGCAPQYITQEQSEKVYERKVDLPQNQIKTKVLGYFSESFVSEKNVININENDLVSGNYDLQVGHFDVLSTIRVFAVVGVMVKFTDNSYKVKFTLKNMYTIDYENKRGGLDQSWWGKHADVLQQEYNKTEQKLYDYITSKASF